MLSARHCYRHWAYGSEKGGKPLSVRQAKYMVSKRVRREPSRLKQSEGGGKKGRPGWRRSGSHMVKLSEVWEGLGFSSQGDGTGLPLS